MATSLPLATARLSKVELRRLRVRRDMARHAVELMRDRGFDATTVEAIAQASDYHPSSFFRYFARKEDAVFVGVSDATDQLRAACQHVSTDADAWGLVREAIVSIVVRFTQSEPGLFALQFDLWMQEPQLQAPLAAHLQDWEDVIADAFAAASGVQAPSLSERVAAGAIVSVLRTCARAPGTAKTFAQRVDQGIDLVYRGFDGGSIVTDEEQRTVG